MTETPRADLVLSYTRVRTALGILGMSLPLILVLGGLLDQPRVDAATGEIEPTISDFYHTTYRDIFVGTLCAIGVFLISYRGYGRDKGDWINDDWLATTAGVGAFGVAFFPNEGGGDAVVSMTDRPDPGFALSVCTCVLFEPCGLLFRQIRADLQYGAQAYLQSLWLGYCRGADSDCDCCCV